jgi:ferritin-like metal-binding protein YciE
MAAKSLQELFVEELRDTYDAEKRLIRALPKMAKAAGAQELQQALTNHLHETEQQVERLEQVFEMMGERARGKKCDGMMGIIEESNTAMEELEGPVLDAALIAGAQRAEHYEMAAYGTLAYFAELLGNRQAKDLLGETLAEEKAADEKLNTIAKSKVNREALRGDGAAGSAFTIARGSGRGAASMGMGMANDTGGSRRSRSTSGSSRGSSSRGNSSRRTSSSSSRSRSSSSSRAGRRG